MGNKSYFLGMDVSKLSMDYCLIDSRDGILLKGQVANTQEGLGSLMQKLQKGGFTRMEELLFGMENTGLYSNPMKFYSVGQGLDLVVANAYDISNSKGIKREKSDSADAFLIAQYLRKNEPSLRLFKPDEQSVSKLKHLQSSRDILLKQKHQTERHLLEMKDFIDEQEYKSLEKCLNGTLTALAKSLVKLEKETERVIKQDTELDQSIELIESIPGVGRQTAVALVTATNNFKNIQDPRKAACHAGVAPFKRESGTSIRNRPRVSNLANKGLKKALHMAALSAIRWCLPIKHYYERKVAEGKNKMSAINAVRNKILHIVYALINKKQIFNYSKMD